MQLKHRSLAEVGWGGCFLLLSPGGEPADPEKGPQQPRDSET